MICVMTAKWVGDAMGKDGIYSVWIAMRHYPWLPPVDYRDTGETGANIMKSMDQLVVINDEQLSAKELEALLEKHKYNGFPVVRGKHFVGFATHDKIREALGDSIYLNTKSGYLLKTVDAAPADDFSNRMKKCSFSSRDSLLRADTRIDLSSSLEEAVLQLRKEVPQELVVNMFQKLNLRRILFTHAGDLTGMTTKTDVVSLLMSHFPHTAALSQRPGP
ncbi:hypothetical protein H0H81_007024 [Sphagnurus paluster]|uniref:CBS domain-containing protein n=1 Tax=Sphagnurus paluster TaxID=117069 RepID=A0A9P7FXJ1_9AGAR|nr:hypothetical protein H0H81_007024 [Sphagnurus paluster]